jgi:hypothetical protein
MLRFSMHGDHTGLNKEVIIEDRKKKKILFKIRNLLKKIITTSNQHNDDCIQYSIKRPVFESVVCH